MISSQLWTKNINLFLPLLTLLFFGANHYQSAMAQQIPVSVSPMNQTPDDNDPFNFISDNSIPPLPTKTPATDTITVNGETTPNRSPVPTNTAGVGSSQSLPSPPTVSEPYRAPSVSPYNQTPTATTTTPNNNSASNNSSAVQINVNSNNTSTTTQSPSVDNSNVPIQRRRSLREIMVFDRPNPAPTTNNNPAPTNNNSNIAAVNNSNSGAFRVFVRANNATEESRVKEIYPEAFRSNYQGNTVWQVGLFSTRQNAEQAAQPLRNAGLTPILTPVN
ncbi:hypothetical protein Cyast_1404 [Cyanobacterium stanieri PCC 7202]|uniref:Sporulation domain-containing protein n=1 Tax=Cyanobacterium stanieri (strain ATCC 29140 / PCC 7202) TaxID=292563 RepID=K9YMM7_CYASC|nr:hypothetical protein Cyast_1404 [Cyanobacterium stanieri PCC 7202]